MHQQTFQIILKWLKKQGYKNFDKEKLEISFLSHPNLGGVDAITDSLDELEIENMAVSIPMESVENLTEPFLSFLKQDSKEQFVLISPQSNGKLKIDWGNGHEEFINKNQLEPIWTGIIIVIEQNISPQKIELKSINKTHVLYLSLSFLFLLSCITIQSLESLLYLLGSYLGLLITIFIVQHQLGSNNSFLKKFCHIGEETDCDSVLNSKAAKLIGNVGLSDVSLVYFITQILCTLILADNNKAIFNYLSYISIIGILFIPYSLYQQKFVIKKWCPLCLSILSTILYQGLLSLVLIRSNKLNSFSFLNFLILLLISTIVALSWVLLYNTLSNNRLLKPLKIEALSFRRNYHLLIPFLEKQPLVSNYSFLQRIEIGSSKSNTKILIVTNPLCKSCIELHQLMYTLLKKHGNLSVELIFSVPLNIKDPRTKIAATFLKIPNSLKNIEEWFHGNQDVETFLTSKVSENENNILTMEELSKHKNWCTVNNVFTTPTILINSKRVPQFYHPTDIQYFVGEIANNSSFSEEEFTKSVLVDNT